ncbi:MAG: alkaline phosphatase family protein [Actinomycetota bacterium]
MRKLALAILLSALLVASISFALPGQPQTIPTGQKITPRGRLTTVGTFPNGLGVSPDGSLTVVTSSGTVGTTLPPGEIDLIDSATGVITQKLEEQDASWGVAFSADGSSLYVSSGSTNEVYVFNKVGGVYVPGTNIGFADFTGSLALSGSTLFVALPKSNEIGVVSLTSNTQSLIHNIPSPFGLASNGSELYASDWRGNDVTAIDLSTLQMQAIPVGDHPEGVALTGSEMLVANSNDASLSFVDTNSNLQTNRISLALDPSTPTDSPSAISIQGTTAYVTLAASNAVAVVDIPTQTVLGYVPTAWYPSAVDASHGRLTVLNARGIGGLAVSTTLQTQLDEAGASPYDTAYATAGALETMPVPLPSDLIASTYLVRSNDAAHPATQPIPSAIKHVIYVVRENKTYDEVLGDMPQGRGDPAYALFPQYNTPNAHAIASRFVLADNFYDPAEASATGHFWTDAADTTDIAERKWHTQGLNASWSDPANYPTAGLLLDEARSHGVSYRAYDEELYDNFHSVRDQYEAPSSTVYPHYDLGYPDLLRVTGDPARGTIGWQGEFAQFDAHQCTGALAAAYGSSCQLPTLEYVYLGGDHAAYGEQGKPTPPSSIADNDAAIGKLVELVSHSSYWSSTAIVMVDDDPQSGGDHISPYRGLILVASPYARAGAVDHTRYSLASAVRFVEQVAGLPPLSQFDATARPLDDFFSSTPTLDPFVSLPETVPYHVFLSSNPFSARGKALVGTGAPDLITNDRAATNLLWEIVRGYSLDQFLASRAHAH